MKRYRRVGATMRQSPKGRYVRFKDMVELLEIVETYEQRHNCGPSCPQCDGYAHMEGHEHWCDLGQILKEAGVNRMGIIEEEEVPNA